MIVRAFKQTRLAITLALAVDTTSAPNACLGFHVAPVVRAAALRRPSPWSSLVVVSSTVGSTSSMTFLECSVLGGRQASLAPASRPRPCTRNAGCSCRKCLELVLSASRQPIPDRIWSSRGVVRTVSCAAGEGEITAQQGAVGAKAEFGLDDNALGELWKRSKKHLISIGKSGIKSSHLRSLGELVQAHALVKVKINIPDADLDLVSRQLCGRAPIDGVERATDESEGPKLSMVMYREAQKVILLAETSFLVDYAEQESRRK